VPGCLRQHFPLFLQRERPGRRGRWLDLLPRRRCDGPHGWGGRHAGAARLAEEAARAAPEQAGDRYAAACLFALCARVAEKGTGPDAAARKELARADRQRALSLLRDALRKGEVAPEEAEDDLDFEALRSDPEFQELVHPAKR
jgi:hypothetical protein